MASNLETKMTPLVAIAEIVPVDEDVTELTEEELEALAEEEAEKLRQKQAMLESLALSITAKFEERARRRATKENQWLRGASLFYGKLANSQYYKQGETPFERGIYTERPDVNIVRSKCNIALANSVSMQFGTSNKNWDLLPEKNYASPENMQACSLMTNEIECQLDRAKYPQRSRSAMWDRIVLGTGILKGPLSVGEMVRLYQKMEGTETWVPQVSVDYSPTVVHTNPWFFYPDETANPQAPLPDSIEIHPMSALDLKKYTQHEGFKADAIMRVLENKPTEYHSERWADFAKMSESNPYVYKDKYLVMEYYGPITRTQLDKLQIDPCYDSVNDEYYGEVWVCQGEVLRIELEAIEASFRPPYYLCPWENDPASVFGFGVPLMMEDAQRVVNESWHMILDNSAISSGPQVAMQKHLIEPANGVWEFRPKALWYLTDPQVTIDQAVQFFNVPNVTAQIVPIHQMARANAEEESCIPLISAGLASPQVGDTATGQLMIDHASTTLLDFMSEEWDDKMTAPLINAMYAWNMQESKRPDIKGVFTVDVRTSTEYKNKQLHIRDLEKLSVESAQNPEMAKWINQGALQRARLTLMTLPSKDIIRTPEEVAAAEEAAAANAEPSPEILKLQLDARRLGIEEAKLEFEITQQQQREQWENEERMTANQARLVESEARVAVSQNEKEVAILQLAAKSEEAAAKLMVQEKIARENNLTKAFGISLQETRKQQETQLYADELEFKKRTGKSGV